MGLIITEKENYSNIANAIRTKSGKTKRYYPYEMAQAIRDIDTGSQDETPNIKDIFNHGRVVGLNNHYRMNLGTYIHQDYMSVDGSMIFSFLFFNTIYSNLYVDMQITDNGTTSENAEAFVGIKSINNMFMPRDSDRLQITDVSNLALRTDSLITPESPTLDRSIVSLPVGRAAPGFYAICMYAYPATMVIYSMWLE